MMTEPLDELYFRWLCAQVTNVKLKNPARTYWSLLRQLHSKEFVWIIPNDDNRLEDGRDLRYEFVETEGLSDVDHEWLSLGCSMLEMLVGLARRLAFEDDNNPADVWFWHMLDNLDLRRCTDKSNYDMQDVEEILDNVIWRTYSRNGRGGLFPLKHADQDQREVELWYQQSAYLLENGG
jgi:hypothetical protein